MADFSAGEAITSGFRLIGRNPAAILWWAGVRRGRPGEHLQSLREELAEDRLAIAGGLVVLLAIAVVVGVARDPGPDPADVAIGYARALGVGDFDAVAPPSGS